MKKLLLLAALGLLLACVSCAAPMDTPPAPHGPALEAGEYDIYADGSAFNLEEDLASFSTLQPDEPITSINLRMIDSVPPMEHTTKRGIGIGSAIEDVAQAYPDEEARISTDSETSICSTLVEFMQSEEYDSGTLCVDYHTFVLDGETLSAAEWLELTQDWDEEQYQKALQWRGLRGYGMAIWFSDGSVMDIVFSMDEFLPVQGGADIAV
ncbi:hypothetical protein LJC56_10215 [Christensenellaceae bacterium OttesenSCG-928-K19]|nr:hypothetical protein [Christensenellaceae bacterium OttesenSCG-928-K19]